MRTLLFTPIFDMEEREKKMVGLLYKLTNTCPPRTPESFYLGGTRLRDIPHLVDEFIRLWQIEYDKKMKWFWIARPLVEHLFINERFVKYSEYLEIFSGSHTTGLASQSKFSSKSVDELYTRHPIFRLTEVNSEKRRQEFILNYQDNLSSYFELMKRKNRTLWTIFHTWRKVAIPKQHRIHTWVTGIPGSGKSELMKSMILQDIRQNMEKGTVLIIDPNSDFSQEVAMFKENTEPKRRDKLVYIDFDLFKGEYTPVINPFQLHDSANRDREIDLTNQQISKALEEICSSFGQPLTSQMQTLLYNCTNILLEHPNSSLWDLQTMLNLNKNSPHAAEFIKKGKESNNPATRSFFREVWESVTSFKDSKAGIYTKVQRLMNMPSFANMVTGKSTVVLKDEIENNKLIIFNLGIGKIGDQAPVFIGKILISLLQSLVFMRAGMDKKDRKPVYLYIDEFQDFISPSIMRILTQGRKYKIFITIANQYIGQDMTTNEQDAILGTTKIKIIGANSVKSHSILGKETDSEIALLKKLEVGEFMVKIGAGEPFILSSPTESLDNKNSMSQVEWKEIINEQKAKYYRKKPLDEILQQMLEREGNILETPPTDDAIFDPTKRDNQDKKDDLDPKIKDDIPKKNLKNKKPKNDDKEEQGDSDDTEEKGDTNDKK